MAFTMGNNAVLVLWFSWDKFNASFYLTCLLFIFWCSAVSAKANGFSIVRFLPHIREELLIVPEHPRRNPYCRACW